MFTGKVVEVSWKYPPKVVRFAALEQKNGVNQKCTHLQNSSICVHFSVKILVFIFTDLARIKKRASGAKK
jgi:hypothetical protein